MPAATPTARLLFALLNSASVQHVGADDSLDLGEALGWPKR